MSVRQPEFERGPHGEEADLEIEWRKSSTRMQFLGAALLVLAGFGLAQCVGWSRVCTADGDGRVVAVQKHSPLLGKLYYLVVEPDGELRPIEWGRSLKVGPPLTKPWAARSEEWSARHYLGCLDPLDGLECQPDRIDWMESEVVVWSARGLVGRFAVR
ncbi:MAG: hypothetical protein AB7O84_09465 [Planctomycetota bacterium]